VLFCSVRYYQMQAHNRLIIKLRWSGFRLPRDAPQRSACFFNPRNFTRYPLPCFWSAPYSWAGSRYPVYRRQKKACSITSILQFHRFFIVSEAEYRILLTSHCGCGGCTKLQLIHSHFQNSAAFKTVLNGPLTASYKLATTSWSSCFFSP